MLRSIRLINFRRYEDHVIRLRPTTLVVGANNAGKSTIVEAIRLVSIVTKRLGKLNPTRVPSWLDETNASRGLVPSLREASDTRLDSIVNQALGPPGEVIATFTNGAVIHIYVSEAGEIFATTFNGRGHPALTRSEGERAKVPEVSVMPAPGPFLVTERRLTERTIRDGMDTPLAPAHFRNQLSTNSADFREFRRLAEETWPALQIKGLTVPNLGDSDPLALLIRDGGYVGEVSTMGHGLQMWLQTMWFLARSRKSATIELDEPDVYMHPDLQRRLIRRLRHRRTSSQIIIATHSVEMMTEADAADVLVIDSDRAESPWATEIGGVQQAVTILGGISNLDLARLLSSTKFLIVEGDDITILRRPYDRLFPDADALDTLPSKSVGGWSGWQKAIGVSEVLWESSSEEVQSYCIFDSDYYPPADVHQRYARAFETNICLHVWRRKEVENYFLVPSVIARLIARRSARGEPPTEPETAEKLQALAESRRDQVIDEYADLYRKARPRAAAKASNGWAREYLQGRLERGDRLEDLACGKELLGDLVEWSKAEFGVTFGIADLAAELRANELPMELQQVLTAVHDRSPLPTDTGDYWAELARHFPIK